MLFCLMLLKLLEIKNGKIKKHIFEKLHNINMDF